MDRMSRTFGPGDVKTRIPFVEAFITTCKRGGRTTRGSLSEERIVRTGTERAPERLIESVERNAGLSLLDP